MKYQVNECCDDGELVDNYTEYAFNPAKEGNDDE